MSDPKPPERMSAEEWALLEQTQFPDVPTVIAEGRRARGAEADWKRRAEEYRAEREDERDRVEHVTKQRDEALKELETLRPCVPEALRLHVENTALRAERDALKEQITLGRNCEGVFCGTCYAQGKAEMAEERDALRAALETAEEGLRLGVKRECDLDWYAERAAKDVAALARPDVYSKPSTGNHPEQSKKSMHSPKEG